MQKRLQETPINVWFTVYRQRENSILIAIFFLICKIRFSFDDEYTEWIQFMKTLLWNNVFLNSVNNASV